MKTKALNFYDTKTKNYHDENVRESGKMKRLHFENIRESNEINIRRNSIKRKLKTQECCSNYVQNRNFKCGSEGINLDENITYSQSTKDNPTDKNVNPFDDSQLKKQQRCIHSNDMNLPSNLHNKIHLPLSLNNKMHSLGIFSAGYTKNSTQSPEASHEEFHEKFFWFKNHRRYPAANQLWTDQPRSSTTIRPTTSSLHHRDLIKGHPDTHRTSLQYDTETFKRGPIKGHHETHRTSLQYGTEGFKRDLIKGSYESHLASQQYGTEVLNGLDPHCTERSDAVGGGLEDFAAVWHSDASLATTGELYSRAGNKMEAKKYKTFLIKDILASN